jgi:hypothetical protein
VRTTPLIGTKAWFGPRRLGWGLAPVSPEGWAVLAVGTVAAFTAKRRGARAARLAAIASLILVVILKGTSPGGPVARREFEEARRAGNGEDALRA